MSFKEYLSAWSLYSTSNTSFLKPVDGLKVSRAVASVKYKLQEYIDCPYYFNPSGFIAFCGSQGQGKTLTACAVYVHRLMEHYPYCILCSNTAVKDRPFNAYLYHQEFTDDELQSMYAEVVEERQRAYYDGVLSDLQRDFYAIEYPTVTVEEYCAKMIRFYPFDQGDDYSDFVLSQTWQLRDILTDEVITPEKIADGTFSKVTVKYWGLDTLKYLSNGKYGVLYFIDEIQLELSNLDRSIPFDIMIEICQQRKQRKHIVGTMQHFKRSAKMLREQVAQVVSCRCFFGIFQWNKLIDGESITEDSSGNLKYRTTRHFAFFHSPDLYEYYDTYAKMKRYNNEWSGVPLILNLTPATS